MDIDDLDIYDDLDTFQQVEEKKSAELLSLESKYNDSLKTNEELQKENADLKKQLKRLNTNFQNLLNTAKAEINRKDKQIERLHKEKDDICFRRNQRWMESADVASTNINHRNKNVDARILTQNSKTQFNHNIENDTNQVPCIAERKVSDVGTKTSLDAYARMREESLKSARRDKISERRNESRSDHEEDTGRRHMQREEHKLLRYKEHGRERVESGHNTTRDNSHSYKSRSREHVRAEKRDNSSNRSYSDSKERNAYSNKSEYSGSRQHSYDTKGNKERHGSGDRSRSAYTETSRERHSGSKRTCEDSKKPTTYDDNKAHKKRNNSDKNTTDKVVKASDDIDHQQNNLVKSTKNVESTCENTKLASIKKVEENASDLQELNKTSTLNKILCEELGANQNSYNIEEKPVAENSLTKENLLALGTETCEKSSCKMTTDGKISPQMTVLFENLFGSSPSRKQSMHYSLLSSAKLENSSSSTTTSPSKYTDSSEQIAPTSKNSLPKSEADECFVPIKGSEPEKSSLSDRNREIQISEENSDDTTTMSSNSANDIAETVKPIEVSTLIALSDDEIQTEFANDGERNDTTDVKSKDESTFEGPTNVVLAGSGGRIETMQDARLPNIYEIRALQRRLKAEAAKLVKNSKLFGKTSKLSVKTSKPSLNTTTLALKTSEISIKKTEMTSNTIAASFINPEENCKDTTKNSLSNPLEESVVTDAVVIANDQKKEIGITKEESGDFEKKKQHTNSESENIVENPAIAKSATTDSIKLEQEISVCKSTAEKLAITNKKETNVVEVQSRCQTPANKSIVSNKTEAEANDLYKVKSNRQSKSEIRIIKAKETILEGYDVGEFHMQSSSKGKNSLLPSNNEKSRIQANALSKSCVVEEKMSGKFPAVLSTNPTECHKPMEKVKDIASATEISDQSKNNEIFQSNMSCENDSFSREDPAKITRSSGLEVNHGLEGNVLAPCEDAVKMKGDTANPVGKKERSNKQKISDGQDIAQVQKFVDELDILNEQKVADKQTIADEQENVNKQKIADEQEFVERQKITDRQEIAHEQKIVHDRETPDEQKVVKTNEKIGIEVQKSADGEVELAKHKSSESPNECYFAIENENTNAKSSETKAAESSKLNRNNRVESNESITQRASKDDNSKAVNAENSAVNVNVNSKNISAIAKSDSDVQADSKQKRVDEKRAVLNGGNSQTDNNRTKNSDIRAESESKELQDELSYLFSSKEVRYLDEIQAKSTKAFAPKAGEEHLKKNKGSAADDQNSEKQTRELVKSRELSLERNALLYNMKRAEIMSKFKIPKISAKRKRENNDEANKANASLENGAASEDGVTRNPKTNDGVEERMDRNKKKPKKEYNSITEKMLLKKDETKVVEINANAEREMIDKRLPNGRTPEEEQALSAEQIQSERIIKEIDNWARRTVGAASEIIENTINESGKPQDSGAELLTTKGKSKVVTASVTQEGQQKTEINSTFPVVQKSSKMGIEKSLTPPILPPQLCEQPERGEKEQLANIAAVNGGDLENVPSHLPNKRCKHNSSADMKASDTFNNQKTDKHKPPKDSKSHQTPTNKSEVNCKGRTKHVAGVQQQRTGQANVLSICSEEGSAKYGKTHDGVDQNAVADGEAIAPGVGVQDLSKMVESSERARKEMTNESQTLKIKKTESGNKTGNEIIQAIEQLECKSKIQHSTEKVSSTSQADSKQVATDIPNNNTKCSFAEKPTENHNSHKEKVRNTAVEKKRDTDEQLIYAAEEPMAADSHEKCTKTTENMKTIENVQKLSYKEISATREATESLPNRSTNVVPSFSNTIIDRPNTAETGVLPGSEYKHSKPLKRHSSDVRTNDECEVISKPHKRKRCQLRIEDSEEEDACNTECATTMLPTPEPQEVSATDSQDIDILDILQNDRVNDSNATLPAPETPSALPANISQDEQYKEIDSRLEQMFASPKVTDKTASAPQVRTLPQPNADIGKLKGFQPVQPHSDEKSALETSATMPGALETEKAASASATRSLDFNVSDSLLSDISCTALQVSDPNVTIDETNHSAMSMNSSLSDGNLSTKRISLGSSDYRFEKISDNVVNLFITRKRRGKRKEMIEAVTTTTIPTNTVSKT
ncbi:CASP8-associated protein 2 isoform X2 [Anastrepha ludens]|uniref:CASP8-associated protein 2 isoform X2 n=1 Tax=Anastrepha ludens TaxID=28586 RepID=UPI0023B0B1A0|nr:CASP8-associated protein 2 isoform X2 [Anastrepha ludens]